MRIMYRLCFEFIQQKSRSTSFGRKRSTSVESVVAFTCCMLRSLRRGTVLHPEPLVAMTQEKRDKVARLNLSTESPHLSGPKCSCRSQTTHRLDQSYCGQQEQLNNFCEDLINYTLLIIGVKLLCVQFLEPIGNKCSSLQSRRVLGYSCHL